VSKKIVLVSLYDAYNFAVRILHTVLTDAGYDTELVFYKEDYEEQEPTDTEIRVFADRLNSLNADVAGFTLRSAFYPLFKRIAPLVDARIIVGGQHPTVCPEDFEGYSVCIGEGENVICEMIEGKVGVYYGGLTKDINIIPFPIESKRERMSVMTTRGCFFNCSFCYNSLQKKIIKNWKVRRRTPHNVMIEIDNLIQKCPNLKEIVFSDNVFTWDYNWLLEFLYMFRKTGLKFRCFGHFGMTNEKILRLLKHSGCHMITMGIQSSERVRKKYFNKNETDEQIIEGSKIVAGVGILGRYDILTNIAYETEDDKKSIKELIANLKRPFVTREFPLLNHPKTECTKRLMDDGHITKKDIQGIATNAYKKWGKFTHYDN